MKEKSLTIKEICDVPVINISLDTIQMGKQALVFVNTKSSAEKTAEEIAKKIVLTASDRIILEKLAYDIGNVLSQPTRQCERLASCVKKGIAFHHAGLTHEQKELVEDHFKKGIIKIISCTPTLAAGLDLPAFRAILKDLKRYGHRGMTYIPVLEYLQMAGRAGRPKYDSYGEAIALSQSEAEKNAITERYIYGAPEAIESKLAVEPVLRTYLLSLIATGIVHDRESILSFFEKTFWAYQYKDMEEIERIIYKMLKLLEQWEFLQSTEQGDFVSGDQIKLQKYRATPIGKRVAELYIDPYTARHFLDCFKKITRGKVPAFAYLHVISSTLEMRPLLHVRNKELEFIEEKLNAYASDLLVKEPSVYEPEYDDFLHSIKTALFFFDWIEEKDEEYLLDTYTIRPGETRAKLAIADWLLYCSEELLKMTKMGAVKDIAKLRIQVKYGVKEELLPLLRFKNIGRVRARKLCNHNIKNLKDVVAADLATLSQLLGKHVAEDLKKQVGQDPNKVFVKEGKRKGQINLGDYAEE